MNRSHSLFIGVAAALGACDAVVDDTTFTDEHEPGVVIAAMTTPGGVQCVRLRATVEATAVVKNKVYPVTAGSSLELNVGRQPEGFITIAGEAWADPCTATGTAPGGDPTWIAEGVRFLNEQGATARVPLVFQVNSQPVADIEWDVEIVQIDSDGVSTVALDTSGGAWVWGGGWGPKPIYSGVTGFVEARTVDGRVCGRTAADSLWCFNPPGHVTPPGFEGNPFFAPNQTGAHLISGNARQFSVGENGVYWIERASPTGSGQVHFTGVDPETGADARDWTLAPLVTGATAEVEAFVGGYCARNVGVSYMVCKSNSAMFEVPGAGQVETWFPALNGFPYPGVTDIVSSPHASVRPFPYDVAAVGTACASVAEGGEWFCAGAFVGPAWTDSIPLTSAFTTEIETIEPGADSLCALDVEGRVICAAGWQGNAVGARGIGDYDRELDEPTEAVLPKAALQLTGDLDSYCALLVDHTVWCWGNNTSGVIGDGTFDSRFIPVRITM